MLPLRESFENKFGRTRYRNIWFCNTYQCGHKEPREEVTIYCEEDGSVDTADDIRVLNILSSYLDITHKEVLERLKNATEANPIEYQGEAKFWAEVES